MEYMNYKVYKNWGFSSKKVEGEGKFNAIEYTYNLLWKKTT